MGLSAGSTKRLPCPDMGQSKMDVIDTIVRQVDGIGPSRRQIALATGMNRSRVQRILHREPAERLEPRVSELSEICRAVGFSHCHAAVVEELILQKLHDQQLHEIAPFLSSLIQGLTSEVISRVVNIPGLECENIVPLHADAVQTRMADVAIELLSAHAERQRSLREKQNRLFER